MWSDKQKSVVWLNAFAGLPSSKIIRTAAAVSLEEFYREPAKFRKELSDIYTEKQWATLLSTRERVSDRYFKRMEEKNIGVLALGDVGFPAQLAEIPNPPAILYYTGDLSLLSTRMLGVVGTRNCTRYGKEMTEKFVSVLAVAGLTIVSGMARGVDGYAHRAALDAGGKTVGVLGTGIDMEYPADHRELFQKMREKGLLVSEYAMGVAGEPFRFPERNRIISGLSEGVLVPEAGLKSGSLITANFALEQGRNLYVIPTNLNNTRGEGGNRLLRTLQGALVLSPDDIAEDMGLQGNTEKADPMQLDFTEEKVLAALTERECHFDELLKITGLAISDLNALLSVMELKGLIHKLEQNYYGV